MSSSPQSPAVSLAPWPFVIESAFRDMDTFLRASEWRGRENEVVNLFAHRFLAAQVSSDGPLRSIRQIGIEVAVPQITGSGKQYVRKDLVIWPNEDMTVFVGDGIPAAIIEWKVNDPRECGRDAAWLRLFTDTYPAVVGYTACATLVGVRGCVFARVGA